MPSSRKGRRPAAIAACSWRPTSPRRSARWRWCSRSCEAVKVPVIAAGGIGDGSGIVAAFALGASGVQIGTAYLCCPEATTSALHKAALADARPRDGHHQCAERASGARRSSTASCASKGRSTPAAPTFPLATPAHRAAPRQGRGEGLGRFFPAVVGAGRMPPTGIGAGELTRKLADEASGAAAASCSG